MTQVRFWYAEGYDDKIFREMYRLKQYEVQQKGLPGYKNPYYTTEQIKQFTENLKQRREPREKNIINKIEEIFGSPFKQKYMICNCIGYCGRNAGWSHPLTICVGATKDTDVIGITLIHELIHIKHNEDKKEFNSFIEYIKINYNITDTDTIKHILVFAILDCIAKDLSLEEENKKDRSISGCGGQSEAIEFLDRHGYEYVLSIYNNIKKGLPVHNT